LKLRADLSKQLDDIVEYERQVGRDQDKVKSEGKVLASKRKEFEDHKRKYQQEMMLFQNVLREQKQKLAELIETHQQREGQLVA
jgi:hypothetical protein